MKAADSESGECERSARRMSSVPEVCVTWKSEERQRFCVEERLIDGDYEPMYQLRQMLQIYIWLQIACPPIG